MDNWYIEISQPDGIIVINGKKHEFMIGDDSSPVEEWVNSKNKNKDNAKMLVAYLRYIANLRQRNYQIERAKSIRNLANFIEKTLNLKSIALEGVMLTGYEYTIGGL
jgi:hypothetical protein